MLQQRLDGSRERHVVETLEDKFNMSRLVVVDPLPLKSTLALLCALFVLLLSLGVAVWASAGPRCQVVQ